MSAVDRRLLAETLAAANATLACEPCVAPHMLHTYSQLLDVDLRAVYAAAKRTAEGRAVRSYVQRMLAGGQRREAVDQLSSVLDVIEESTKEAP